MYGWHVTNMSNSFLLKTSLMLNSIWTHHAFLIMHEYVCYKRRNDYRNCADTKNYRKVKWQIDIRICNILFTSSFHQVRHFISSSERLSLTRWAIVITLRPSINFCFKSLLLSSQLSNFIGIVVCRFYLPSQLRTQLFGEQDVDDYYKLSATTQLLFVV